MLDALIIRCSILIDLWIHVLAPVFLPFSVVSACNDPLVLKHLASPFSSLLLPFDSCDPQPTRIPQNRVLKISSVQVIRNDNAILRHGN